MIAITSYEQTPVLCVTHNVQFFQMFGQILTPLGRVLDVLHCNIKRYENHCTPHVASPSDDAKRDVFHSIGP